MSDADFLGRIGTDGAKWAAEFRRIAIGLGYSDMDEGWLIGWFANAIEAGRDAGRAESAAVPWSSMTTRPKHRKPAAPWSASHDHTV